MSSQKISQLPNAVLPLRDNDLIAVVQNESDESTTNKVTVKNLKQSIGSGGTGTGSEDCLPLDGSRQMYGDINFKSGYNGGINWRGPSDYTTIKVDNEGNLRIKDFVADIIMYTDCDIQLNPNNNLLVDATDVRIKSFYNNTIEGKTNTIKGDTTIESELIVKNDTYLKGELKVENDTYLKSATIQDYLCLNNQTANRVAIIDANKEVVSSKCTLETLEALATGNIAASSPYGSMYATNIASNMGIAATNGLKEISNSSIEGGLSTAFTHNNGKLTCTQNGTYNINWSLTCRSAANKEGEFVVLINGVESSVGTSGGLVSFSGNDRPTPFFGTGIYRLRAGDTVSLGVRNKTDNKDFVLTRLSLTAMRIGN